MFDVWIDDFNPAVLVLIVSLFLILPVQLLLCFKAKRIWLRLLPVIVCGALTVLFLFMAFAVLSDWDGIGYLILAIYTTFMLTPCGLGWGIWALWHYLKKNKT